MTSSSYEKQNTERENHLVDAECTAVDSINPFIEVSKWDKVLIIIRDLNLKKVLYRLIILSIITTIISKDLYIITFFSLIFFIALYLFQIVLMMYNPPQKEIVYDTDKAYEDNVDTINEISTENYNKNILKIVPFYNETSDSSENETLMAKASRAFVEFQHAWSTKNLTEIRRYISDGMYTRLHTQIKMLDRLLQKSMNGEIYSFSCEVIDIQSENGFDVAHIMFDVTMFHSFYSPLDSDSSGRGIDRLVEYWSFIKRSDSTISSNLYGTNTCPHCGSSLEGTLTQTATCPYCNAIINNGTYDWILSEITQYNDWNRDAKYSPDSKSLKRIQNIFAHNNYFGIQDIEDRVSTISMLLIEARASANPAIIQRYITDELFDSFTNGLEFERFYYNQLSPNSVTVINAYERDGNCILFVSAITSFQRVNPKSSIKLDYLDDRVETREEIFQLEREINGTESKDTPLSNSCCNCGSPLLDLTSYTCPYCNVPINDTAKDWVVTAVLTSREYRDIKRGFNSNCVNIEL